MMLRQPCPLSREKKLGHSRKDSDRDFILEAVADTAGFATVNERDNSILCTWYIQAIDNIVLELRKTSSEDKLYLAAANIMQVTFLEYGGTMNEQRASMIRSAASPASF